MKNLLNLHESVVAGGAGPPPPILGTPVHDEGHVPAVAGDGLDEGGDLGVGGRTLHDDGAAAGAGTGRALSCTTDIERVAESRKLCKKRSSETYSCW